MKAFTPKDENDITYLQNRFALVRIAIAGITGTIMISACVSAVFTDLFLPERWPN
jgi:hypothetical protein